MARHTRKPNNQADDERDAGLGLDVDALRAEIEALRSEVESLRSDNESLRSERDELQQRFQRAAADYQNLKRRGLADADERLRRALQPLLDRMLYVLDYLDMALACPTTTDEAKNLAVGVRLTRDQFLAALEAEDVRPVPPKAVFDPSVHEAKAAVGRADVAPGTVLETVRAGYTWRGEILRYAHVVVAKAPESKPDPAPEA